VETIVWSSAARNSAMRIETKIATRMRKTTIVTKIGTTMGQVLNSGLRGVRTYA